MKHRSLAVVWLAVLCAGCDRWVPVTVTTVDRSGATVSVASDSVRNGGVLRGFAMYAQLNLLRLAPPGDYRIIIERVRAPVEKP